MSTRKDQQEANARLIAAAPELIEALKGEATVIDGKLCWCGMPNMIPYRGHDSGCEYNRELIAKVEGEMSRNDGYCMRRPDGTIECRRFVCHQPCAARPGAVSDVEVDASDYERPGRGRR